MTAFNLKWIFLFIQCFLPLCFPSLSIIRQSVSRKKNSETSEKTAPLNGGKEEEEDDDDDDDVDDEEEDEEEDLVTNTDEESEDEGKVLV